MEDVFTLFFYFSTTFFFPSIECYLELLLVGRNWATLMIYTAATYKSHARAFLKDDRTTAAAAGERK